LSGRNGLLVGFAIQHVSGMDVPIRADEKGSVGWLGGKVLMVPLEA
jgi:hypothetical protein